MAKKTIQAYHTAALASLEAAARGNLNRYGSDTVWADRVKGAVQTTIDTKIVPRGKINLLLPSKGDLKDVKNAIRLHKALPDLSLQAASDPRLWVRLAHVDCWAYMRRRWDVSNATLKGDTGKQVRYVREHYFMSGNRGLTRHGLARLWWYAHLTHDPTRTNPYELTNVLLRQLDIAQQIVERTIGRAPGVMHGFLGFILEHPDDLMVEGAKARSAVRNLAKHLHFSGGRTVLDLLDAGEIKSMLAEEYEAMK